jgi:hypothetical protein
MELGVWAIKFLRKKLVQSILENDVGIQQIVWISEGRRQPVQFKSWPKILPWMEV